MSCINCTDGANESQSNGALKNLWNNNNFSWNNNKMRKQMPEKLYVPCSWGRWSMRVED